MHTAACKEFYANLIVFIYKKKGIAKSRVKGVETEFNSMKLASILDVPGHTCISEYIKDVWKESKYIKPLEITRKFANNSLINVARRVQSIEMKPFQRFMHFVVLKNVVPRFEKRDTTSFMDLTYMDHLVSGRKINLPRVMMRHMPYVISVKDHELPYAEKKGWNLEAVIDEAAEQGEFRSDDQFFDAQLEVEEPVTKTPVAPAVPAPSTVQQKCPTGRIPEAVMNKMQAEFETARANRFQADLEKAQA
ncbi:hypothetical protein Dimus_004032 [Dionaea muscipula]